ncbi:MAG TPA: sulfurtransferase TusA family protein [Usitatibacteraceae bacterium]|jgi:TusA-related sulfurtransferase|nr:sulfurtransferase TusA family protein [Burkholderiales bacterium]HQW39464.1 sulfurtransferase TusA family protein [Usitatibacteraceae bacterium]MBX3715218.1 sulfurtransferase TusA family protein [Burkholderiales bacterium]MBZ0248835.1 sulfurtransferase TusA family protein [Burkholderiales bacterium]MCL4689923.1 sulfurtransferase TusA family protein [Burkholderiales bacterium]
MSFPTLTEPAAMVDLTGLTCPGPILGAREILESLRDGQVLLLLSDCPGTRDDLFAWARQTGNEVIHAEPRDRGATGYYVRKGRSGHVAAHVRLDLRGVSCPGPIVEARQLLKGMRSGEVLKLVSDCPGVRDDVAGWAEATRLELLDTVGSGNGAYEFYLRKL